ncbi:MAG: phosphate ABC transporter permease, partial [Desulfobacteraceae bacterium]|nr:phosphate ABC transporter permease [Desulfobacteraceae bacterium]
MKPDLADRIFKYFSWGCSLILVGAVFIIIGFLIIKGYNALNLSLIFSDTNPLDAILLKKPVFDGLLPAI